MNVTETADLAELLWALGAALGLLFSVMMVGQTFGDLDALRLTKRNGRLWTYAVQAFRNEALRALRLLIYVSIGIVALFTPPAALENVGTLGVVAALGLFGTSIITVLSSVFDFRDRRELLRATIAALLRARDD
jgi:hypothetical protein